jgi:Uma2 family endonuclease
LILLSPKKLWTPAVGCDPLASSTHREQGGTMGSVTGGTIDLERCYTIADLDGLPEDGRRYELADGRLLVSPMARRLHQIGCRELGEVLTSACPAHLYIFPLPINVDDPDSTHFEPDLTVVRREFAKIENGDLPLLAVEVRSPSTAGRDAVLKRREYARLGMPSYWMLDVDVPSLTVLELVDGDYVQTAYGEDEQPVMVNRPFPVTVVPARLLEV